MLILHVVGAGGGQPERDALLREHLDIITLTTPELAEEFGLHGVVASGEVWPDIINCPWDAIVVEKWPWGDARHEHPLSQKHELFLEAIEDVPVPTVIVRRKCPNPWATELIERTAAIYDHQVDGHDLETLPFEVGSVVGLHCGDPG